MNRLTFDDYAYHAWTTAYFLDVPADKERQQTVEFGFREEVNELLTDTEHPVELRNMFWGRNINPQIRHTLSLGKTSEAGDILFYLSAAGMLRRTPLRQVGAQAIKLYTGDENYSSNDTFTELDQIMKNRMVECVPEWYNPEYFGMQFFGITPFDEEMCSPDSFDGLGNAVKGPLSLGADGLYVLERLSRDCGEYLTYGPQKNFVSDSALLLGALSAVLQNRFNSSLAEAAELNIIKRERRATADTLQTGGDTERSRPLEQERPRISGWESTQMNLFYNLPADNLA